MYFKLFLVSVQIITISFARIIPEEVIAEPCKLSDANLNDCLLNKLENARPYLMQGIKEINLPGLDPLIIPRFEIDNRVGDLVQIKATVKNVKIEGNKDVIFESVSYDPHKMEFDIKTVFPHVEAEFEYDVFGKLLSIPLENKGILYGNCTDTPLEAKVALVKTKRNNEEYFKIKDMVVVSRVGGGVIKLISKNPNFQYAADVIIDFFNRNPRIVFDAVNPIYVDAAAQFFTAFFRPIIAKIPIKEILIE